MTQTQQPKKRRFNLFNFLLEIVIDLMLMGMGAALYIHFLVFSFGPVTLSPVVVNLFGSLETAVYVIAGVPFIIGLLSFLRTLYRVVRPPSAQQPKK